MLKWAQSCPRTQCLRPNEQQSFPVWVRLQRVTESSCGRDECWQRVQDEHYQFLSLDADSRRLLPTETPPEPGRPPPQSGMAHVTPGFLCLCLSALSSFLFHPWSGEVLTSRALDPSLISAEGSRPAKQHAFCPLGLTTLVAPRGVKRRIHSHCEDHSLAR